MSAKVDLKGKVFGRLTVLGDSGKRAHNGGVLWECKCSCGVLTKVRGDHLIRGHTASCGCMQVDSAIKLCTTHGMSKDAMGSTYKTFEVWNSMIYRVRNTKPNVARYYRDKGITVCERWHWYPHFLMDMGERPKGKTLDRIDGTKGYYKDNCKWATPWEQGQNRSNSKVHVSDFEDIQHKLAQRASLSELAQEYGVPYRTMVSIVKKRIPALLVRGDVDKV